MLKPTNVSLRNSCLNKKNVEGWYWGGGNNKKDPKQNKL